MNINSKSLIDEINKLGYGYDYHPLGGGIIYKAQEYFEAKRLGIPTTGIRVINIIDGSNCGFIHENNPTEIDWNYYNER